MRPSFFAMQTLAARVTSTCVCADLTRCTFTATNIKLHLGFPLALRRHSASNIRRKVHSMPRAVAPNHQMASHSRMIGALLRWWQSNSDAPVSSTSRLGVNDSAHTPDEPSQPRGDACSHKTSTVSPESDRPRTPHAAGVPSGNCTVDTEASVATEIDTVADPLEELLSSMSTSKICELLRSWDARILDLSESNDLLVEVLGRALKNERRILNETSERELNYKALVQGLFQRAQGPDPARMQALQSDTGGRRAAEVYRVTFAVARNFRPGATISCDVLGLTDRCGVRSAHLDATLTCF